jgi:hypothetical protein
MRVLEVAAFAADGFGDQRPGGLFGRHHPGRVELNQLHVLQPAAGSQRQVHAVAGVLIPPGGRASPDPSVAPRRQDHCIGQEHGALAGLQVEGERPETDAIGDQQLRHVLVVDHGYAQLGHLGHQGAQDRPAGPVARIAGPPPPVGAEEALVEAAIGGARERGAPVRQLQHGRRCLPGHEFDHPGVGQEVALPQGVAEVLLPGVLRVHRTEGSVDPAGRQHRVGVIAATFADHHDLAAGLVGGDRGAQPGRPGPDHQDVGDVTAKRRTRHLGGLWGRRRPSAELSCSQDAPGTAGPRP